MARTDHVPLVFVKDWLTSWGGSEQQLLDLLEMYPDTPVYTSVFDRQRLPQFAKYDIRTMRFSDWFAHGRRFEYLAPILPFYFGNLRLKADIVVSVTSGFAKAARSISGRHISICNTPLRFAWNFGDDDRGLLARLLAPFFRRFDRRSSRNVDLYLANSTNVAQRIKQCYGRDSEVVYPPVHVEKFLSVPRAPKPNGWVTINRLVSYKRVDIIVEAATKGNIPLTVIGDGPEMERLKSLAGPTVKLAGFVDEAAVKEQLSRSSAFIFAANEDFGIVPVEAMAAGVPVLAYGVGGATETVVSGTSGLFFSEQTADSLLKAWSEFQTIKWDAKRVRDRSLEFSSERFKERMKDLIEGGVDAQ